MLGTKKHYLCGARYLKLLAKETGIHEPLSYCQVSAVTSRERGCQVISGVLAQGAILAGTWRLKKGEMVACSSREVAEEENMASTEHCLSHWKPLCRGRVVFGREKTRPDTADVGEAEQRGEQPASSQRAGGSGD